MTPDDLAALDAMIAALEEQGRTSQASSDRLRAGERDRLAATMDADLMALMTPGSGGNLVGPWLDLTCPKGHKILAVRAVSEGPEQGVWLMAGGKHALRTTKALFQNSEAGANRFFGVMPGHPQTSRLTDRRVWECPVARCGWTAPIDEVFLQHVYAEATKRGARRVALAMPTVSR